MGDLRNVANMQTVWKVPCFVGEFNLREEWKSWVTTQETFALNPMFKLLLMPASAQ